MKLGRLALSYSVTLCFSKQFNECKTILCKSSFCALYSLCESLTFVQSSCFEQRALLWYHYLELFQKLLGIWYHHLELFHVSYFFFETVISLVTSCFFNDFCLLSWNFKIKNSFPALVFMAHMMHQNGISCRY